MARQRRIHPPGGIHHVTARGNDRIAIFRSDADRQLMLTLIGEASQRHRCSVLAYCLMTNHIHLTIRDLDGSLSKALKYVNGVYAQRFNLRHGRTGHLFDGRFWNSLIESDSYLATASEYVHRNPVEAGLVARPEQYRWSSYRAYAGLSAGEPFLDQRLVLGLYGNDRKLLRAQTLADRRDRAKEDELGKRWPSPVLGSPQFCDRYLGRGPASRPVRTVSDETRLVLDEVVSTVAAEFDVSAPSIVAVRRGSSNQPRRVAIHLAATGIPLPHAEIAQYFGLSAANSVSTVSKRCSDLAQRDAQLLATLDRLARFLTSARAA